MPGQRALEAARRRQIVRAAYDVASRQMEIGLITRMVGFLALVDTDQI